MIDQHAVDIIHPDLATSGGLLETKRIGDYAEEKGVAMAMHFAGTPVSFMANVHCAAATQTSLRSSTIPLIANGGQTLSAPPMAASCSKRFCQVPLTAPGLGIELNDDEVKST